MSSKEGAIVTPLADFEGTALAVEEAGFVELASYFISGRLRIPEEETAGGGRDGWLLLPDQFNYFGKRNYYGTRAAAAYFTQN